MLKVLLKKQFLESNAFYFQDKKTGKLRSVKGIIGYSLLMLLVFGILVASFASTGFMLKGLLYIDGFEWMYYALMGIMALLLGCFGSVFNTYSGLYQAKDNELLLSMPLKPSDILLSRLFGVFLMSALYSLLVWIPGIIVSWIVGPGFGVGAVIVQILMSIIISILVMVISCALGWLVAIISGYIKNKSFITVIVSLLFMFGYYLFIGRMNVFLTQLLTNPNPFGRVVKGWLHPIFLLGKSCVGSISSAAIFTMIVAVLFGLCCFIMEKSFIAIVTMKRGSVKAEYHAKELKVSTSGKALLSRELKRFLSSPTYMLNSGFGIIIMPVLGIAALVKAPLLREFLSLITAEFAWVRVMLPIIPAAALMALLSTDAVSASSVSLEGNTLWLIRSLPVSTREVLGAKLKLHTLLNIIPAVICAVLLSLVLELELTDIVLLIAFAYIYTFFCALFGLMMNILRPNLSWTSETVPVKQSLPVFLSLFGGWVLAMLILAGCWFLRNTLSGTNYLIILIVVFSLISRAMNTWINKRGVDLFEQL